MSRAKSFKLLSIGHVAFPIEEMEKDSFKVLFVEKLEHLDCLLSNVASSVHCLE